MWSCLKPVLYLCLHGDITPTALQTGHTLETEMSLPTSTSSTKYSNFHKLSGLYPPNPPLLGDGYPNPPGPELVQCEVAGAVQVQQSVHCVEQAWGVQLVALPVQHRRQTQNPQLLDTVMTSLWSRDQTTNTYSTATAAGPGAGIGHSWQCSLSLHCRSLCLGRRRRCSGSARQRPQSRP